MVIEQPPKGLGTINDMWFQWIIDIGFPGPDRGEGGKYLIVPPGYDGPLPDSGFHVARSRTKRVLYAVARVPHEQRSEADRRERSRRRSRSIPTRPAAIGTSIATALEGKVRLEVNPPIPADEVRRGERQIVQHDSAKRLLASSR